MNVRNLTLALLALLLTGSADDPPRLPSRSAGSVFHIVKSENRNQVHYAVDVDARCRPLHKQPIRGYWREYEEGPNVVDDLTPRQQPVYGLSVPRSIELAERGGDVRLTLRAMPERLLRIATFEQGGGCRARAFTPIQGQPAVLDSVYVEIGFLGLSIDYLVLRGFRVSDGAKVQEKVED